ncbi:MAG: outer membrane protein assembly factor BamA [Vicinamibacteria bacterium]
MTLPTIALVLAVASSGASERFVGWSVSSVELSLTRGQLPEEARTLVEVQPGDPYDPAAIRRSIKQLFALGSFSDIKVVAYPVGDTVSLTFELYPQLTVGSVSVAPESSAEALAMSDRILKVVAISAGESFDAARVEAAESDVETLLKRRGYLWAEVEAEARFPENEVPVLLHCVSGPRAVIRSLDLQGLPPNVEQHVRQQLGLGPGDSYDADSLQAGVDRVLAEWRGKGFYEAALDFHSFPEPPDQVRIELTAAIGPRVVIRVVGASLNERTIDELVPIREEASVSEDLIEESRANLEGYFRERGYTSAQVAVERERAGNQRLTLIFNVQTGARLEVAVIRFAGSPALDWSEVRTLLKTRTRGAFRSAPFVAETLDNDLQEIRRYLLHLGYHRAHVWSEVLELDDEPGAVEIAIHVDEGPRAYLESITVDGAHQITSGEILSNLDLRVGEVLDASKLVAARERTLGLYRNRGFRQAVVEIATELDETGEQGKLSLFINEGTQTRVDRIIIAGLERTKEEAVRTHIALSADGPLSSEQLVETRQGLIGTGLFRDVRIEVLPADPVSRASDVLIQVEEGPRTTVGYGFGYSERDQVRVEGQITRHNMLGTNRSASLFGRGSFRSNRLIFTFDQPDTFGLNLPSFVSAFREEEDRTSFDFIRLGAGMQVLKRVSRTQTLFFRYNFERTKVFNLELEPEEVDREFRNLRLSKIGASSIQDTRDDPQSPTRGQFRVLDVEWAAKFLGTQAPYVKALAQQFWYVPVGRRLVGVVALRGGVAQSFREDRDALIPITERFFAGGANTLRGFGLDEASPQSPSGQPVGGNVLMLVNLELRFPILGKLGGVVFSDNGKVYRRLQVIELLNWHYNVGFGFRYDTPFGPLRVDYGRKLNPAPDEPQSRFHVSLGHPF